ncbi:MAG: serine/threonine-protein kinase [Acidobacteriota bacterium]
MTDSPDRLVDDPQDDDHDDLSPELLAFAARIADGDLVDKEGGLGPSQEEDKASTKGQAGSSEAELSLESAQSQVARIALAHRAVQRGASPLEELSKPRLEIIGTWGPHQLLEPLGAGTSAQVYRARELPLDREVALKLLAVGEGPKAMEEGRLLAQLDHPHIATVFGTNTHPLELFDSIGSSIDGDTDQALDQIAAEPEALPAGPRVGLWMELIRGETLAQRVDRQGPFSPKAAARIGADLASALATVHEAGLVHCDVKAANVLIEEGTDRVVLVDFGIGRAVTTVGRPAGTPLYLAPEVLNGQPPGPPADVYSLGVLVYFLLTGRHPIEAESLSDLRDRMSRQGNYQEELVARFPLQLREVVRRCLFFDPSSRPDAEVSAEGLRSYGDRSRLSLFHRCLISFSLILAGLVVWVLDVTWRIEKAAGDYYGTTDVQVDFTIDRIESELERWPYIPSAWSTLADLHSSVGNAAEALEASATAKHIKWFTTSSEVPIYIDYQYHLQRGDFGKALDALEKGAAVNLESDWVLRNLAMAYLVEGNLEAALSSSSRALENGRDDVVTQGVHGLILSYSDPKGALDHLQMANEELRAYGKEDEDLTYLEWPRGVANFRLGRLQEAIISFRKMKEDPQFSSKGSFLLAQALYAYDQHDAAVFELSNEQRSDLRKERIGARLRKLQFLYFEPVAGGRNALVEAELLEALREAAHLPIFARRVRSIAMSYTRLDSYDRAVEIRDLMVSIWGDCSYEDAISATDENIPPLVATMICQIDAELALAAGDVDAARYSLEIASLYGFEGVLLSFTKADLWRSDGDSFLLEGEEVNIAEGCASYIQDEPLSVLLGFGVSGYSCY